MPNPLQYLQHPGVVLVGAMTIATLIMLLVRGDRDKDVKRVCAGYIVTGILLVTIFGATAPNMPVSSSISTWFALVSFGAGVFALYFVYKVWDLNVGDDWLDMLLLGLIAMSYLTLACELYLVGRDNSHSHWTGLVRRLPVFPLWVAAALILVAIALVGYELWVSFTGYRRKLRQDASKKVS